MPYFIRLKRKANMEEVRMRKDPFCNSEYRENIERVILIETEKEAQL
jgi:hypothetical protein